MKTIIQRYQSYIGLRYLIAVQVLPFQIVEDPIFEWVLVLGALIGRR